MRKALVTFLIAFSLLTNLGVALGQEKITPTEADYNNESVEMADVMRENGKIYVVVAVVLCLFAGLTFYAVSIDRKVTSLEKQLKDN